MSRPGVAFFEFTSCEGCQLTVVDSLQTHLDLLESIEIVQFREAISERGEDYAIAFIEGCCARPGDEAKLRAIREQAAYVVALGACAHLGGINAIRNRLPQSEVGRIVYGEHADWFESYTPRPISKVIQVDVVIPGCPIDREEFVAVVKQLLQGRIPVLPENPLCVECKLKENVCVYLRGKTCLGPITRAGCAAICPSFGDGCEGCRGLVTHPNIDSLRAVLAEHGLSFPEAEAKMTMFLNYQMMELEKEVAGNGTH
jgi:coenzyme F420-reducing hydrogenase gamma subunit